MVYRAARTTLTYIGHILWEQLKTGYDALFGALAYIFISIVVLPITSSGRAATPKEFDDRGNHLIELFTSPESLKLLAICIGFVSALRLIATVIKEKVTRETEDLIEAHKNETTKKTFAELSKLYAMQKLTIVTDRISVMITYATGFVIYPLLDHTKVFGFDQFRQFLLNIANGLSDPNIVYSLIAFAVVVLMTWLRKRLVDSVIFTAAAAAAVLSGDEAAKLMNDIDNTQEAGSSDNTQERAAPQATTPKTPTATPAGTPAVAQ